MRQPVLYLFIGYPGAGKTTIAQLIAARTGAVHVWADLERHRLFANPSHSEAESTKLYEHLNAQTEELLRDGKSVVFDTNFNHYADREKLRRIAAASGAETMLIWVTTPTEIARERAVHSDVVRNNYDFMMTAEQFDAIASKLEPPTKNEKVIKIDGANIDKHQVVQLLGL